MGSSSLFLSLNPLSSPSRSLPFPRTFHLPRPKSLPKIPSSSFKYDNSSPPETDCPVPAEQQPINEFQSLSNSFPFSWASLAVVEYSSRLSLVGATFAVFVALPVSWFGSMGPKSEPLRLALGCAASGLFVVILAVVWMYLGWAYVGNRLLSATVEYEETGWYDGQIWVKTAEVLARDRLLGSFSVKPVLNRLKNTLVFLGISLLMCVALLTNPDTRNTAYIPPKAEPGGRAVAGAYSEESARNFEPEAFCGERESFSLSFEVLPYEVRVSTAAVRRFSSLLTPAVLFPPPLFFFSPTPAPHAPSGRLHSAPLVPSFSRRSPSQTAASPLLLEAPPAVSYSNPFPLTPAHYLTHLQKSRSNPPPLRYAPTANTFQPSDQWMEGMHMPEAGRFWQWDPGIGMADVGWRLIFTLVSFCDGYGVLGSQDDDCWFFAKENGSSVKLGIGVTKNMKDAELSKPSSPPFNEQKQWNWSWNSIAAMGALSCTNVRIV